MKVEDRKRAAIKPTQAQRGDHLKGMKVSHFFLALWVRTCRVQHICSLKDGLLYENPRCSQTSTASKINPCVWGRWGAECCKQLKKNAEGDRYTRRQSVMQQGHNMTEGNQVCLDKIPSVQLFVEMVGTGRDEDGRR